MPLPSDLKQLPIICKTDFHSLPKEPKLSVVWPQCRVMPVRSATAYLAAAKSLFLSPTSWLPAIFPVCDQPNTSTNTSLEFYFFFSPRSPTQTVLYHLLMYKVNLKVTLYPLPWEGSGPSFKFPSGCLQISLIALISVHSLWCLWACIIFHDKAVYSLGAKSVTWSCVYFSQPFALTSCSINTCLETCK